MKVTLPNGEKLILDENISLEEKTIIVKNITDEHMPTIISNWNSNSIKYFLDSLSNYLVWHKDEEEKEKKFEDKYVLSRKKVEKLTRYKKTSKSVNFSDLSKETKELLLGD